jgi:hypothetical protein
MSESKHTPGPWEVIGLDIASKHGLGDTKRRWIIAEVAEGAGGPGFPENQADPAQANAHLIAAAPDMLEAAERLVQELDAIRPDAMDEDLDAMPALRRAIAKAKGEAAE